MIRPLGIVFVHFVSRYFNVKLNYPKKLPKEMPKIVVSLRSVFFLLVVDPGRMGGRKSEQ